MFLKGILANDKGENSEPIVLCNILAFKVIIMLVHIKYYLAHKYYI